MTNEQLTQKIIEIAEHQAKYEAMCIAEKEQLQKDIAEMKEEIKDTKSLAESVHIMAERMTTMQETQEETNKKVEELIQKDYNNYVSTKETIKKNIISGFTGAAITIIIAVIGFLIKFMMKGE